MWLESRGLEAVASGGRDLPLINPLRERMGWGDAAERPPWQPGRVTCGLEEAVLALPLSVRLPFSQRAFTFYFAICHLILLVAEGALFCRWGQSDFQGDP